MKTTFKGMNIYSLNLANITLILLLLLPSLSFGEKLRVTIIPSSSSNAYITTANHIKSTIKNDGNNLTQIKTIDSKDLYINKTALIKNTDLFVTIGQRALKETLKHSGNIPVLASLIPKSGFINIISEDSISNKHLNIGAVYIDQPLKRYLLFSRLVLPNSSQPGFILSSNNKNAIDDLNALLGKKIHHIGILNPGDNVISTLSRVLENADSIIALPDPIVFNLRTTRNILLSTYRKRTPVIGFSKSYAKAGALAAIYSMPELIGKQIGEYISQLAKQFSLENGVKPLTRTSAKYFSISVNNRVSRSLGLPILDAANLERDLLHIEKGRYE